MKAVLFTDPEVAFDTNEFAIRVLEDVNRTEGSVLPKIPNLTSGKLLHMYAKDRGISLGAARKRLNPYCMRYCMSLQHARFLPQVMDLLWNKKVSMYSIGYTTDPRMYDSCGCKDALFGKVFDSFAAAISNIVVDDKCVKKDILIVHTPDNYSYDLDYQVSLNGTVPDIEDFYRWLNKQYS